MLNAIPIVTEIQKSEPIQWLLFIAGVVGAIVVIAKVIVPVCRGARQFSHFIDDYNGEEARNGVPARPGVMARLASIDERLKSDEEYRTSMNTKVAVLGHELAESRKDMASVEMVVTETRIAVDEINTKVNQLESLDHNFQEHVNQSNQIIAAGKEVEAHIKETIAKVAEDLHDHINDPNLRVQNKEEASDD